MATLALKAAAWRFWVLAMVLVFVAGLAVTFRDIRRRLAPQVPFRQIGP